MILRKLSQTLKVFIAMVVATMSTGILPTATAYAAVANVTTGSKAVVCKYSGQPGIDEVLQTVVVVDRKDSMVVGSSFQDAQERSYVVAFVNPPSPSVTLADCPPADGPDSVELPYVPVVDPCGTNNATYGTVPSGNYTHVVNGDGSITFTAVNGYAFTTGATATLPVPEEKDVSECATTNPCAANYFPAQQMWEITWGQQFSDTSSDPTFTPQFNGGLVTINGAATTWNDYHLYVTVTQVNAGRTVTYGFADGTVRTAVVGADANNCPSVVWTETPPPTIDRADYNLTSMCKLSTNEGQFRIRNQSEVAEDYSLVRVSDDTTLTGTVAADEDKLVTVEWNSSSDTWKLTIAGEVYTKAIGDNALCEPEEELKKVFVCKYVGKPGVDERLKEGKNPISVAVNSIDKNDWDGTVPGYFNDAQDRSYVLSYDTTNPGPEDDPNSSECPDSETPTPMADIDAVVVCTTEGAKVTLINSGDTDGSAMVNGTNHNVPANDNVDVIVPFDLGSPFVVDVEVTIGNTTVLTENLNCTPGQGGGGQVNGTSTTSTQDQGGNVLGATKTAVLPAVLPATGQKDSLFMTIIASIAAYGAVYFLQGRRNLLKNEA